VEEELRALSVTDSLTGIHNRRYFQERLTTEMARVERGGGELSVIMLDIDHFKRINDQYGRRSGAAGGVRAHRPALRRTDVFCRLGGEEFMVLCPDIDGEQAYMLAVELWQGLRSAPVDGGGWSRPVSAWPAGVGKARMRCCCGRTRGCMRQSRVAGSGGRDELTDAILWEPDGASAGS
jgi:diguanylate cyclase (GGDEF)-like protein